MLWGAFIAFVLAAGGGLILVSSLARGNTPPRMVTVIHGLAASTGIVLLAIYTANALANRPLTPLVIFILAALGGFTILALDLGRKRIPKALLIIHPLIAVAALVLLIVYVMNT